MFLKAANLAFLILFLLSAIVQYNDPDPFVWIVIYLYGTAMCFMGMKGMRLRGLLIAGIVIYVTYALYLFFAEDGVLDWFREHNNETIVGEMKATKPWIEQTREFFGLLILVLALLMNLAWPGSRRKKPVAPSPYEKPSSTTDL